MHKLLTLQEVGKRYGKRPVLSEVTWSISRGECVAVTGGNGAGKSTLLGLAAGLARPSSGSRIEHAVPLTVGYVPERFPPLKFRPSEYLRHMAAIQGLEKAEAARRIDAMMNIFGLPDTMMNLCSKGMLQKANVMQALLGQPDLLVLDEPLSGLDEPSQLEMVAMLSEIKRQGTAIAMSVHESLLIAALADRVTTVSEGRITRDGLPTARTAEPRMRVEYRQVQPEAIQRLERHPGFLYWISRGSPAAMVVRQDDADDIVMELLRCGGSLFRLEPLDGPDRNEPGLNEPGPSAVRKDASEPGRGA